MKKLLTIVLAGTAMIVPAMAADLPPPEDSAALTVKVRQVKKVIKRAVAPRTEVKAPTKVVKVKAPAKAEVKQIRMTNDEGAVLTIVCNKVCKATMTKKGKTESITLGDGTDANFKNRVAEAKRNGFK